MTNKIIGLDKNAPMSPQPPHFIRPPSSHGFGDAMPVGSVIAFAGEIRRSGDAPHETNLPMFNWLKCDGASLNLADYPELFCALGYRYGGKGDVFKLPDLRGEFLRGVDETARHDGSLEKRKSHLDGEENKVGSSQGYALEKHTHGYQKPKAVMPVIAEPGASTTQLPLMSDNTSEPQVCSVSQKETRPVNTFVYWLIKTRL
jgi:microcystin-dependent protein